MEFKQTNKIKLIDLGTIQWRLMWFRVANMDENGKINSDTIEVLDKKKFIIYYD